jgi:glutamate transport system permease protein
MSASVLFDEPGPRARARFRIYNVVFGVIVIAAAAGVVYKFNQAGQFESRIYERLGEEGTITEISRGLTATLKAAAIAIVTSLVLGVLLAFARLSDHRWVRAPATGFVELFRAVPLVLLIVFIFGVIRTQASGLSTETSGLTALVAGLTLYNGSVLCEVFRAGVNAVPKGQREAAYAIGMRKHQVMNIVLVPQGVRYMLPAIISQCVVVLKDTSLGFIVVYGELLRSAKNIATYVGSSLVTYLVIALIYVTMNSVLSLFAYWLERRLSTRGRGAAEAVEQVEDVLPVG